jgi:GTP-binding protein
MAKKVKPRVKGLPVVAIVGRPNVGKSTLFNRLIGRHRAIVEDTPGVTRDRHYADADLGHRSVTYVDTGGFVPEGDDMNLLAEQVRQQAQVAIEESHVVLFVVDGRSGLTVGDEQVARSLRAATQPVLLIVNKVDRPGEAHSASADFHKLGFGVPIAVSAEHAYGTVDVEDAVLAKLPPMTAAQQAAVAAAPQRKAKPPAKPRSQGRADTDSEGDSEGRADADSESAPASSIIRIAIVGRPNVGKSTLINALVEKQRLITSEVAGTTRDPIDIELESEHGDFVITDTAGIRRKAAISHKIEEYSVTGAIRSIEDSDVAVLVLDATEPAVDQDARIAQVTEEKGRPLLIVVNKWDLMRGKAKEETAREELKYTLKWVSYAPVLYTSAKEGYRVTKVLEMAAMLHREANFRAPTPQLNRLLKHITTEHPAPFHNSTALRLYYCAQVAVAPPTFNFICNRPKDIPERYQRYILNQLRETFGLRVPVRLLFRPRPGADKRKAINQRMKARRSHKQR